jgi:hypothetical protein
MYSMVKTHRVPDDGPVFPEMGQSNTKREYSSPIAVLPEANAGLLTEKNHISGPWTSGGSMT